MKNWSIMKKLLLASCFSLFPSVILSILMTKNYLADLRFSELEVFGNRYQAPLEEILENASMMRLINKGIHSQDLKEWQAKMDSSFLKLKELHERHEEDLQFDAASLEKRKRSHLEFPAVYQKWQSIKEAGLNVKELDNKLAGFIYDIRAMISHAGDTSNLILDPDLDSYYIMDVTLLALPQYQDRLADFLVKLHSVSLGPDSTVSSKDLLELMVMIRMLKSVDMDRVLASTQIAINEDDNFYGPNQSLKAIIQKMKELESKNDQLLQMAEASLGQGTLNPTLKSLGAEILSLSFSSWGAAAKVLEELLQNRMSSIRASMYLSLLLGSICILIAILLTAWVFNDTKKSFMEMIQKLYQSVESSQGVSQNLVAISTKLSSSSHEESSAIAETVSTLTEISTMVNRTKDLANDSLSVTEQSFTNAQIGNQKVLEAKSAINNIGESNEQIIRQVEDSNQKIAQVIDIIKNIGEKTKVINDIVFQTKLLSFNASVEAARAGEQGKGFAVVAEEVGNLASMSGNAAKEISDMLNSSTHTVQQIVNEMQSKVQGLIQDGRTKVNFGNQVIEDCSTQLARVVEDVKTVKSMVHEIANSQVEQSRGLDEISKAMNELDNVSHTNANNAGQISTSTKEIEEHSGLIASDIEYLKAKMLKAS